MQIEPLSWDSDFFGLRIGKVSIDSPADAGELSRRVDRIDDYDLLYVFANPKVPLKLKNLVLVDKKVIYHKQVLMTKSLKYPVRIFSNPIPNGILYDLALQSGIYSRFRLDGKFPLGSFERLYRCWIEQSVCGNMADVVLCVTEEDNICGMLTLKIDDGVGRIGLVSVDIQCRCNGYGSVLLEGAENYLLDNAVQSMEVATQMDNQKACHWYEKNGYSVKSVTNIYHLWF